MAIETEEEVRAAVSRVAPGAKFTSAYRTPEHNEDVGGVPGSLHTRRGEGGGARALDIVPGDSGLSMAELNARIRQSGLNLQERLNEGDHVHVGFDGKPSGRGQDRSLTPGVDTVTPEWVQAQGLDAERFGRDTAYAQASMTALGYVGRDGQWVRDDSSPVLPAPMDNGYAERMEQREALALDQEEAQLVQASLIPEPVLDAAGAVAGDVAKGVLLEGGSSILSGAKRGFNAIMDLTDEAGDWIEQYVPGTVAWEGFDGDASTPARIFLTTQNKAQERQETAQGGERTLLQRLGAGRLRMPTSEGERPESVTGRLIEGVTQFATGFAGGGNALRAWRTAGRAGRIGKNLVQGSLADFAAFDGQEERLSNLLADHAPEALAPALNWLAASDDDGELEGRFKNAVEGGILGGAVDVLGVGIRRLKAAREVRDAARDAARAEGLQVDPTLELTEAAARGEELQEAVRSALGNPAGPRMRVVPETNPVIVPFQTKIADQATDGIAPRDVTASADNVFDINLARINTPEDVQAVIVGMADKLRADVDLARRGRISHEQTRANAGGVDWVDSMANRQPGGAVNAETALAYRLALNSSATKLLELAKAVEAEPTLANQFAFRRATATHSAIQNELMGARAEAGRALNAFRIPADAPATYLRQIDSLIADVGGANSAIELAKRIRQAAAKGDKELNQMVRGGAMAHTREIVKLVYTNSLLSGLGTPIINVVGNGMMLGLNFAARSVSPRLAGAFGGKATMQAGEASALVHGYQQAFRDMFRMNPLEAAQEIGANAGERLRRDGVFRGMAPGIDEAMPSGVNLRAEREEAGSAMGRPLAAAAWRVNEDSTLGRVLDVVQMLAEAPSNFNSLTDDFFKTVAARGELHAQAFRRVTQEGLTGEAARSRMAELIQNPTDDILSAMEKEMHELTFTRQGGFDKWASAGRRMIDENTGPVPLGTMLMPFLRTPANLVSVGMRYSPLAPMMKRFRDELAEGGAAAEMAKARMALGTALTSVYIGMAMDGDITGRGPGNRAQREAMQRQDEFGGSVFQPYSIRVGNRWFSFERADPMGQMMGLMADMADLVKNGDWDEAGRTELDEVWAHGIASVGQAFFDKTALRGLTEMTSALLDGSNGEAERLLMSRASTFLPLNSALRTARRAEDPYLRETHNVVTAMMNTMPGLSEGLPPQRDLWGRERRYYTEAPADQIYNTLGLQSRGQGGSAIDLEILNNGVSVAMPSRSISVAGETVSLKNRPDIYSEFLRLAGEPAFAQLNAVAEGTHPDSAFYYSLTDGPEGGKAEYIREVVTAYRAEARAMVTEMFASDLQAMAADRVRRREEARAGE